ncbi:MAG: hypothetical protein ACI9U2_001731 [Bradymonadia bacterium]|jgi:hypothetical protein
MCLLWSCDASVVEEQAHGPLIDHQRWTLDDADPPGLEHRPSALRCPPGAVLTDGDVLDVSTDDCNYLAVQQPSLGPLRAGEFIEIQLAHLTLFDPVGGSGQAHAAVALGEHIYWETWLPIPAAAQAISVTIAVIEDLPTGTSIRFHLHNHGANEWTLFDIARAPDSGEN